MTTPKRGRPRKDPESVRSERIVIPVTPAERDEIAAKAPQGEVASWARNVLLKTQSRGNPRQ